MNPVSSSVHPLPQSIHFGFAALHLNDATQQRSLYSAIHISPGIVFSTFGASTILRNPNRFTLQTDDNEHIILAPEFLQYVNHSCDPNIFFDVTKMQLRSLKPVMPGDEFTFFYPSTEWDMSEPFECTCGGNSCLQKIRGARHLPWDVLRKYELSDFIKRKINQTHLYIA